MSNFNDDKFNDDKLDLMLKAYCNREEDFAFKKPKILRHTALIAACLVPVILAGIVFIPNLLSQEQHSFIIVANAQSLDEAGLASGDELSRDYDVVLATVSSANIIHFDLDEPLLTDAPEYNMVKNYLFYSVFTNLEISIEGENIESVTYTPNKGGLSLLMIKGDPEDWAGGIDPHKLVMTGYEYSKPQQTISYNKQDKAVLSFTPVFDPEESYEPISKYYSTADPLYHRLHYFSDNVEYVYSDSYKELFSKYGYAQPLGTGYHTKAATIVTEEEKSKLIEYAEADDMRGFFNYQSLIFRGFLTKLKLMLK